jgi:hypothetical protein
MGTHLSHGTVDGYVQACFPYRGRARSAPREMTVNSCTSLRVGHSRDESESKMHIYSTPRTQVRPEQQVEGLVGVRVSMGDYSGRLKPRAMSSTAATVRYISQTPVTVWTRPSRRCQTAEPRLAKKSQM